MTGKAPRAIRAEHRGAIRKTLADFGVAQAGVFGSTARGEDHPGSDLDLIVEFEPGRRRDLIRLTEALVELTGLHVDVVDHEAVRARAVRTGIGSTILRDTVPL